MKVGFFDSGIGGLTVLSTALSLCPTLDALYFADTDHLPYGEKPKELIREYALQAGTFLCDQGAEAIVVACNTATSAAIEDLRRNFSIPVIGMEPAVSVARHSLIMPADRILVLATRLTLQEEKYLSLLEHLGIASQVDSIPLPGLVDFAEQAVFDEASVHRYLNNCFSTLDSSCYASVVLGCTHFPYFQSAIRSYFPARTSLLDGRAGTVRNLLRQIPCREASPADVRGSITYYRSGRKVHCHETSAHFAFLLDHIQREDSLLTS